MKPAAIGIRTHSGWGALVAVSNSAGSVEVVERRRVVIATPGTHGAKQPYHFAENLDLPAFSGTALDQGPEDGCACRITGSGKPEKSDSGGSRHADDAVKNSLEWAEGLWETIRRKRKRRC